MNGHPKSQPSIIMNSSAGINLDGLVQMAHQAALAGRMDEAAHVWERVLAASPYHAEALFNLGQYALHRKDTKTAQDLLERAATIETNQPAIPLNLSFVFRALGDANSERDALMRALAIDPFFYPAMLSNGMLLERIGKRRSAAKVYKDMLNVAPPPDQIPTGMRAPLEHARDVVRENAAEMGTFLRDRLRPLEQRHAGQKLDRFEECKDVAIGVKKIYTQQPSMLHFPRLPAIQFYDNAEFPWLKDLEASAAIIRDEVLVLLGEDSKDFHPYVNHPAGVPIAQWAELNHSPRWNAFHLWRDGKRFDEACKRCPQTATLLERLPMLDLAEFGPTVLFSCLAPHTRIPSHSSVTNVRLVVHLPLIVPGKCRFRVGNETREWQYGKAWVFDDTIEHEAWNDSDKLRVILMVDVWNPYLSDAERELVTSLLNEMNDYYKDE